MQPPGTEGAKIPGNNREIWFNKKIIRKCCATAILASQGQKKRLLRRFTQFIKKEVLIPNYSYASDDCKGGMVAAMMATMSGLIPP